MSECRYCAEELEPLCFKCQELGDVAELTKQLKASQDEVRQLSYELYEKINASNAENDDNTYAIIFEDAEVGPEIIFDKDAAFKAFDRLKDNWNCHLFHRIKNGAERTTNPSEEV